MVTLQGLCVFFAEGIIYCAFRHGAGNEMRDESRRYGLCDGIMQISHPQ